MKTIKDFEPIFGSWYIDELIGEGSFGKVYSAHRDTTGERENAAIKYISIPPSEAAYNNLRIELNTDNELYIRANLESKKDSVLAEYKLQSKFRGYTNFVDCQDISIMPKTGENIPGYDIFIRMEKLKNLAEVRVGKRMEPAEAAKLGIDVCRALELLKRESLVHRDLKPQNIFVSKNGDYKIGDFGVARELSSSSMLMTVAGTTGYMAPEIAKGENSGFEADIYSLGIVMYRQLSGYAPFMNAASSSSSTSATKAEISRLTGERIPDIPGIPEELNRIVHKACEFEKTDRYKSPEMMRKDLEKFLESIKPAEPETIVQTGGKPHNKEEEITVDIPTASKPEKSETVVRSTPLVSQTITPEPQPKKEASQRKQDEPKQKPKGKIKVSVLISAFLCLALIVFGVYMLLKPKELTAGMVKLSYETVTYTGSVENPEITVTVNTNTLVQDKDYTVSYEQSIDAGKYDVNVTGKGRYTGNVVLSYSIIPKDITNKDVSIVYKTRDFTFSGNTMTKDVDSITYGAMQLERDVDYTVGGITSASQVNVDGGYELTVTGLGNYRGTVGSKWNINAKDLSDAQVEFDNNLVYNGSAQKVVYSVKIDGVTLDPDKDYSVENNSDIATNAGSHVLKLRGYGNYDGICEREWTIDRLDISDANILIGNSLTYNGGMQTVNIMRVKLGEDEIFKGNDGFKVNNDSDIITDAGEYTLTLYGTGNYKGTASKVFTVLPKSIRNGLTIQLDDSPIYNGKQQRQTIKAVYFGDKLLTEDVDYELVSGYEATERGDEDYILTIKGIGNFTDTTTASWNIQRKDIENGIEISLAAKEHTDSRTYIDNISVAVSDGTVVLDPKNYTYKVPTTVDVDLETGTYTVDVEITGKGNYCGSASHVMIYTGNRELCSKCQEYWNSPVDRFCTNCGAYIFLKPTELTSDMVKLSYTTTVYTGQVQKPLVSVADNGRTLVQDEDYSVSYVNAVNVGKYNVTITGKGHYQGSVLLGYNITAKDIADEDVVITYSDEEFTYSGSAVTNSVNEISYGAIQLKKDMDYTIGGTTSASQANTDGAYEMVIKGQGNFTGSVTAKWRIKALAIDSAVVKIGDNLVYNGKEQTVSFSVEMNGVVLEPQKDYTVQEGTDSESKAGTYVLRINGIGNYCGVCEKEWVLEQRDISGADIRLGNSLTYSGNMQTMSITRVKIGEDEIYKGNDGYKISGDSDIITDAGEYTLTIYGTGNYKGTASKVFTVLPKNIRNSLTIQLDDSPIYNSEQQRQTIKAVYSGDTLLAEGVDYEIVSGYEGTYRSDKGYELEIKGIRNYTGSKTAGWNIQPKAVSKDLGITVSAVEHLDSGKPYIDRIAVSVSDNGTVLDPQDYSTNVSKTIDMDLATGAYHVGFELTGKNNYSGVIPVEITYTGDRIQCDHCHNYWNAAEDMFCGRCGARLNNGETTSYQAGDVVKFGHYEQDNMISNGKEAIEWVVLEYDAEDNRVLLLSCYGLDVYSYHSTTPHPTWEKSDIRKWLNNGFLNAAFTDSEQASIVSTKISTPSFGETSGSNDTMDKIWLLSKDEARTYFKDNKARRTTPTKYAVEQGAYQSNINYTLNGVKCCSWWLRSPSSNNTAAFVFCDGIINSYDYYYNGPVAVRPALWLDLDTAAIS